MASENSPSLRNNFFVIQMMNAARKGNLAAFNLLMGNKRKPLYHLDDLKGLFKHTDESGNTVFHYLLQEEPNWFLRSKKKRQAKSEMCFKLLRLVNEADGTKSINSLNHSGFSAFHLAIKEGYSNIVDNMLEIGADLSKKSSKDESSLELATKFKRTNIFKKLLEVHSELNREANEAVGFTSEEIKQSLKIYLRNLQQKQTSMGIIGTIMTIACPVGSILAFHELPLLELLFSSIIPGVGPIIGLVGAILIGGLLFWSMYSKSSLKYGSHAQELISLDAKVAEIDRLEAELRGLQKQLHSRNISFQKKLTSQCQKIVNKLEELYGSIETVELHTESPTRLDEFRTVMLTTSSFLCAFSGVLGILSGLSSFLPAVIASSAILAGVPVVGWIALGVAVLVGISVAAWAYHAKFKPALEQSVRARQELHEKKFMMSEMRDQYELNKLNPSYNSANILTKLVSKNGMPAYGTSTKAKVELVEQMPVLRQQPSVTAPLTAEEVFQGLNYQKRSKGHLVAMNEQFQVESPATRVGLK